MAVLKKNFAQIMCSTFVDNLTLFAFILVLYYAQGAPQVVSGRLLGYTDIRLVVSGGMGRTGDHRPQLGPRGSGGGDHGDRDHTPRDHLHQEQNDLGSQEMMGTAIRDHLHLESLEIMETVITCPETIYIKNKMI